MHLSLHSSSARPLPKPPQPPSGVPGQRFFFPSDSISSLGASSSSSSSESSGGGAGAGDFFSAVLGDRSFIPLLVGLQIVETVLRVCIETLAHVHFFAHRTLLRVQRPPFLGFVLFPALRVMCVSFAMLCWVSLTVLNALGEQDRAKRMVGLVRVEKSVASIGVEVHIADGPVPAEISGVAMDHVNQLGIVAGHPLIRFFFCRTRF